MNQIMAVPPPRSGVMQDCPCHWPIKLRTWDSYMSGERPPDNNSTRSKSERYTSHAGKCMQGSRWIYGVTYVPWYTKGLSVRQLAGHLLVLWPPRLAPLDSSIIIYYAMYTHLILSRTTSLFLVYASGKLLNYPCKRLTKLSINCILCYYVIYYHHWCSWQPHRQSLKCLFNVASRKKFFACMS